MMRLKEHRSPVVGSDSVRVTPGETFRKSWLVRNDSSIPWPKDVTLVPVSCSFEDSFMTQQATVPGALSPGDETEVSVIVTAPTVPGIHECFWRAFGGGRLFGQQLRVEVTVVPRSTIAGGATDDGMDAGVEKLSLDDRNKDI